MRGHAQAVYSAAPPRDAWRIREYLANRGLNMTSVAASLGVSLTLVRETIYEDRNNRRVLRYLMDLGCPEEYLGLPYDMLEARQ